MYTFADLYTPANPNFFSTKFWAACTSLYVNKKGTTHMIDSRSTCQVDCIFWTGTVLIETNNKILLFCQKRQMISWFISLHGYKIWGRERVSYEIWPSNLASIKDGSCTDIGYIRHSDSAIKNKLALVIT